VVSTIYTEGDKFDRCGASKRTQSVPPGKRDHTEFGGRRTDPCPKGVTTSPKTSGRKIECKECHRTERVMCCSKTFKGVQIYESGDRGEERARALRVSEGGNRRGSEEACHRRPPNGHGMRGPEFQKTSRMRKKFLPRRYQTSEYKEVKGTGTYERTGTNKAGSS